MRPEIGGVLIRGEKGTAKSTAVRGLANVLSAVDGASLVELPIGATEDRVVGSLDLQKVLRDGEHAFSPGLLARAHGGVLYVDEVNLLHDHLVDVILDAAAMGRVHVERDGVSHSHDARFVLIGTMNPEEGELRPQLLDRFGLTVDVHASRDVDVRVDVIRQRMAFEADPVGFADRYAEADAELARRVAAARASIDSVDVAGQRVTSHRGAVRGLRRRRDAGRSGGSPHRRRARRVAGRSTRWPRRTSGWRPNSRCRTGVAATRSTTRGLIPDQLDEAMAQAGESADEPQPEPDPDPPGGGESPSGETSDHSVPQRNSSSALPAQRGAVAGVPHQGARRSRRGGGRAGSPVSGTQPHRKVDLADRRTRRPATVVHVFGTLLAAAGRQRRPGRPRPTPTTCVGRSGKAAKAIW